MAEVKNNKKPKPGDLIKVIRGVAYQHWAVYIGDGYVVHLTSPSDGIAAASTNASSVMSSASGRAIVKKEKLLDVVGTNKWKVQNSLDDEYIPRLPEDIVKEAKRRVGETVSYNLSNFNCEHFATELRYSKRKSKQIENVHNAATAGALGALVAALGAAVVAVVNLVKN